MTERKILYGLSVTDYMHPLERDFLFNPDNGPILEQALDQLTDLAVVLTQQIIFGKYVEIKPHMMPRLEAVLKDVCAMLGLAVQPRLFITHDYQPCCMQAGSNAMYILIPDLMAERADDDMLYYLFGNSVGMFKGGHLRLATVNSVLQFIPQALPFRLPLQAKQRAADLSSDRAGLLACQNFAAACRCIFWDLGMPPDELFTLSDEETLMLAQSYPRELEYLHKGLLTGVASQWKKWNGVISPGFFRIHELYQWYQEGYPELMQRITHPV